MAPNWVSAGGELKQFVFDSHAECINANSVGRGGEGVHIGIVDSAYSVSDDTDEPFKVEHNRRFIDTDQDLPRPHGFRVFDLLSHFAPFATFSFYQVIGESGSVGIGPYHDAIDAAINDEVDILNLSLGAPWDGPAEASPYHRKAVEAIQAGITVVAAGGNYKEEHDRDHLCIHQHFPTK